MSDYLVDFRDIRFVLFEQLGIEKLLGAEKYSSFGRSDLEMVLDEALKLAKEAMGPANRPADREGCRFEDGKVHLPEVFRPLYKTFVEGGWLGMAADPSYGGQGMPSCIGAAATEMFMGGCLSFNLVAMLTTGAAGLVHSFGTQELKDTFLAKMYSGQWSGTMCLTEAGAGSDVGLSKCKARKDGDHYLIEGEKIFITAGDHDLTENIIHMVLARTEGAPKGVKGLSLFLVPKFRVNADGSLGEFNDIRCTGIEHKLGIHGSPTCTLAFGQEGKCWGFLLGNELDGIKCMFQMMNEARVAVGLQGAALANAAYHAALGYARERLQGSDITKFKDPTAPTVAIINHPDIRLMLLTQKAYAEGLRALLYSTAYFEDMSHVVDNQADKNKYTGLLEILTPICKAYASDMAFRVTELAVQTYGGYGYISEYPAEQYLRDAKIASIYEGTNGIQALDLVGRKLTAKGGMNLFAIVGLINDFISAHKEHPALAPAMAALVAARDAFSEVNMHFMMAGMNDPLVPVLNATPYLSLFGDVVVGFLLLQQGVLAHDKLGSLCQSLGVDADDAAAVRKLAEENDEVRFYDGKVKTARFFAARVLPGVRAKAEAAKSGDRTPLEIVL